MVSGRVRGQGQDTPITGKPQIQITVANPADPARELTVTAVVDTGATIHLTLSPDSIAAIGLRRLAEGQAALANGTIESFPVYAGLVSWQGRQRLAPVFASESEPLLGMAMLWGSRLMVEAWDEGAVVITENTRAE